MNSQQLADEVQAVIEACKSRILGVGAEQYSQGDTQKFETMTVDGLTTYLLEEVEDMINYGVMLRIRMKRFARWAQDAQEEIDRALLQSSRSRELPHVFVTATLPQSRLTVPSGILDGLTDEQRWAIIAALMGRIQGAKLNERFVIYAAGVRVEVALSSEDSERPHYEVTDVKQVSRQHSA